MFDYMVSCILLAAGESRRFGSPKPLARLGSQTVIEFIQNQLLLTRLRRIIIVLGAEADKIAPLIFKNPRISSIYNKDYHEGQTSSFKAGLQRLSTRPKGILLLPVDTPLVKPETMDCLIQTFLKQKPLILLPVYQNKNGHPPVFSTRLTSEFKQLDNNQPLYLIQQRHADSCLRLPVKDKGVIESFNTQEELKTIIRSALLFSAPPGPSPG